jgi:hypothetical protein
MLYNNLILAWGKLKKLYIKCAIFIVAGTFVYINEGSGQVSNYVFSSSNGTYQPDAPIGSSTPAAIFNLIWDDTTHRNYSLPFAFYYNGIIYPVGSKVGVDSDGWIALSSSTSISMTGTYAGGSYASITDPTGVYLYGSGNNNGIAGFNADIEEQSFTAFNGTLTNGVATITGVSSFANIQIGTRLTGTGILNGTVVTAFNNTTGTITMSSLATAAGVTSIIPYSSVYAFTRGVAPNRQFVVQWTQVKRHNMNIGDRFSFQIILNEAGGNSQLQTVQVVYGTCTTSSALDLNVQVGLRGNGSGDFNARKSTTGWASTSNALVNTDFIRFNNSLLPSSGLTYTWFPCVTGPGGSGAISGPLTMCNGGVAQYTVSPAPLASYYTWAYTGTGANFQTTTLLPINQIEFTSGATNGTLTVTPGNLCGIGSGSSASIIVNGSPTATISYPSVRYCKSTLGTISVIQTGTTGGSYSSNGSGLTINTTNGSIMPSSSIAGTYTVSYQFTSGICSNTVSTSITIHDNPVVTVTANPSIFCSGSNSQLQAIGAAIGTNYTLQSLTHQLLIPNGLTTTIWNTATDEAVSAALPIPFAFSYYGSPVTQLFVSSNGYVQLQNSMGSPTNVVQTLPNVLNPNAIVALCWQDLIVDPSVNPGANVRYFVNGSSPNRVFVIDYIGLSFYRIPVDVGNVTGQIRFYETDQHIEIAASIVNDLGNNYQKTLGIENQSGTLALTPSNRNKTSWNLVTGETWGFYPPTGGSYSYAWSPATFLNNTGISNPLATAVNATTSYNVSATHSGTGCVGSAINTITVSAPLNGTYTVGTSGTFATLTAAINAYNNVCIAGPVTFILTDANYSTNETFPLEIRKNAAASATNTLLIKPAAGVNSNIVGTINSDCLIRILGDYVTIDGSNNGSSSRNLSIGNLGTSGARTILFGSNGTVPITRSTLKNCTITNGTVFSSAIVISDAASINAAGYFNNLTIENNSIRRAYYGIYGNAAVLGGNGNNTLIRLNDMSSTGANAIQYCGIFLQGTDGALVERNLLANFTGNDDLADKGIWLAPNVKNTLVNANTINNLNYTGSNGFGAQGIFVNTNIANANVRLTNNMIANISGDGDDYTNVSVTLNNPTGILLSGSQSGIFIYHNSISLGGSVGFTNTLNKNNAVSTCIRIQGIGYADIRNNIMVNNLGRAGSIGYGAVVVMASSNSTQFVALNYNCYAINPTGSGVVAFGMMNNVIQTTLPAWRTATGKDAASINVVPVFTAPVNLRLVPASNASLNNSAVPIAGFNFGDIDSQTRNALTPDMGCDEFLPTGTAVWVGNQSVSWTQPENWEAGIIPDGNTDVIVTGGYVHMPTVSGTQALRNLNLSAPAVAPLITLSSNSLLQINGDINLSGGKIDAALGTILMNGTNPQTLPAGLFLQQKCLNLRIGNSSAAGVTLGGALDIYRSLEFTASGLRFNTGDFLTLKSTATLTAWLGNMTGKVLTGKATVERFIPSGLAHGKSWQYLSVPVYGNQTINQAWQDTATAANQNRYNGYGTQITSNISPLPAMFDVYTPAGATMKTYDPASDNWLGVPNTTSTPISNKKGYLVFVRGDRSVTAFNSPANTTVLRAKGNLYTASVGELPPVTTVLPNKFESIGNPYASAIDFVRINKPGSEYIDQTFYVWDPLLPGTRGLGGYQTISSVNGYFPVPGGTANYCGCVQVTRIESGQAFLVHATGSGSGGNISFSESAKETGSEMVFRNNNFNQGLSTLRAYLFTGSNGVIADGNAAVFGSGFHSSYTGEDALKVQNAGENFGILRSGVQLSVEARPAIALNDTLFYQLSNLRKQAYQFRFAPVNLGMVSSTAWLVDQFLQTETALSLNDSSFISFTVNDNPASAAASRFYIVFRPVQVLPVNFTSISASRKADVKVKVNWTTANEMDIEKYEIERSTDGGNFEVIGIQVPLNNNGQAIGYSLLDKNASSGNNFYRIKAFSRNGQVQVSPVAKVTSIDATLQFSIHPNPVQSKRIQLHYNSINAGKCNVHLIGANGQILYRCALTLNTNNGTTTIEVPRNLPGGNYTLVIVSEDHLRFSLPVSLL